MNTVEVGNAFEKEIVDFFKSLVSKGQFPFRAGDCEIFRKKGYFSKDRNAEIVFDASIEVYIPGTRELSLLYLIECKNYSSKAVSVDEVEEFESKVRQVSGAKGAMVTRTSFQSGTLEFARSKRIALLRYFNGKDFKWVLHRSHAGTLSIANHSRYDIDVVLTSEQYLSRYHNFFCAYGDTRTNSLREALLEVARDSIEPGILSSLEAQAPPLQWSVAFLPHEEIEERSHAVLRDVGYNGGPAPLEQICQAQLEIAGLTIKRTPAHAGRGNAATDGVLGRIAFDPLEIIVYEHPSYREDRQRFTLAHELGHHFLGHSAHLAAEYCESEDIRSGDSADVSVDDIKRMEWQANSFASCLVLPHLQFLEDFVALARTHDLKDRGHGLLFVDAQPINQATYYAITESLKAKYRVSRSVVKYRLHGLGLLNDARDLVVRI